MTTSNGMNLKLGVVIDEQKARRELDTKLRQLSQKSTIQAEINIDGERFVKTVRVYEDAMKNLVEQTTIYNGAGKKMTSIITNLESAEERASKAIHEQAMATKIANDAQLRFNASMKSGKTILQDFADTFFKMAKFNTINIIYDSLTNSISNAITVVKEFNDATTELKKVSDLSGDSLKAYTKDLAEYGEEVGRTMTDMVNSATIFKRTGATDEEAMKLAKIAEMYRNVADSEISSAEASSFLVSQMKAFNYTADQSIHVIDSVNSVANAFAVSTNDLQTALAKSAAAMATAGNSYEETIALVEAGTAIMQGQAGTVGNGLRTIAINVANLATASDEFVAANGKVAISLKNEKGEIRSTYEVLDDLSQYWDKLTRAEQNEIAVALAGKTRYNVLTSVMRNFADAQAAVETAIGSTNSAMEENSRYMESIQAKLNIIQAEYQKFVLGDGGLEDLIKDILDIGIAVSKTINSLGGLSTVLKALGTILAVSIVPNILKSLESLKGLQGFLPALINHFKFARANSISFSEALAGLTASATATQIAIQGVVAVVGIAITLFNVYKQKQQELAEAAHEASEKALDEYDAFNMQLQALEKENASRSDLIKAIQAVDNAYKDEGQSIDDINKKRQEAIDKLKEEGRQALENARNEGFGQRQKDAKTLKSGYIKHQTLLSGNLQRAMSTYQGSFQGDTSEEYLRYLENYQKHLTDVGRSNDKLNKTIKDLRDEITESKNNIAVYDDVLLQLGQVYDTVTGKIRTLLPSEIAQAENTDNNDDATKKYINTLDKLGVSYEEVQGILNEDDLNKLDELLVNQDIEGVIALLQQYGIEVNNINDYSKDAQNIVSEFSDNLEDLQSAYETLTKAADEYNQNGYISASTLKKLNKLSPEYIAALYAEGDAYDNINKLIGDTLETEKASAIEKLELAKNIAIVQFCQEELQKATENADTAIEDIGNTAEEATPQLNGFAKAALDAGRGVTTLINQGLWNEDTKAGIDAISKYFDDLIANVGKAGVGAVNSSKENASKAKDAWVEAFEEEQRQLKHALEMNEISEYEYYERLKDLNEKYFGEVSGNHEKYIKEYQENEEEIYKGLKQIYDKVKDYLKEAVEQGYEKAINAIKKEEKNVLAEIKKQIEALKKEKKSVLDGIKDQVNALKKEKEAVQKYWNDQIDAIKRENEVLQEQNELLEYQQALEQAKAKKVMVMQDGRFQLTENESAVAEAEQNLSQYQDQLSYEQQIQQMEDLRDAQVETLEQRIEALEDYYDYMEDYYDRQIESMEEYYNNVQEQYEKQIEALQAELDAFKEGYQKQEDLENARLAAQVLGINERSLLYETDLENLKNYINSFNQMLAQLGEKGATVAVDYKAVAASHEGIATIGSVDATVPHRASGDASFRGDEIALVGESPNAELVLGSKLNRSVNSGTLVNLSRGSGVVNAESTSTLAGLLNGLAKPSSISNSRTTQQNFNFGTISLPNVSDADSFVNTLSHKFNNYAIQYGNTRR